MLSLYTFLPHLACEILMMSHSDVMIICSTFQQENHHAWALEPSLFICKYAGIHVGTPCCYESSKPHRLLSNPFSMPVTYIYIYIYRREMNPPGQSIIDALNTATLHIYIGGR